MIALLLALTYNLTADQADYDGKTLILAGHFHIDHPMGGLSAEKATIENLQLHGAGKKTTQLHLENNVEIESVGKTPFLLKAKRAICDLPPASLFSFFQIQEIRFFDQVEIATIQDLLARGGSALYKLGTLTLFPTLPTASCKLYRGEEEIHAQEIRFELPTETLHLKGNVLLHSTRIKEKESFASADSLLYRTREKTLTLSSIPPKKVLFWQDGLSLSASEVQIKQDPETEEETIEGFGDVHFTFDLEEQNFIKKFIANYL